MKKKKQADVPRNWVLVVVASVLIVIGLALIILAIAYATDFGWWSLLIGLAGLSTVGLSVIAIVRNDPSWILLGLILPG